MDNAVALVEAYLRVNGYLTVAEYPIVEAGEVGGYRARAEIDILGFRFPGAGRLILGEHTRDSAHVFAPDPALGLSADHADMLIGEVKEGRAQLNSATRDSAVLRAVLTRFGCCGGEVAPEIVERLLAHGHATMPTGHIARMALFGAQLERHPAGVAVQVSMAHVVRFLQAYLREHWSVLSQAQSKDPAFGFLLALEKAARGDPERGR